MIADFETAKGRAIERAMQDGAARYVDMLADQLVKQVPPDKVFTRDEVVELLRGTAEGMRGDL